MKRAVVDIANAVPLWEASRALEDHGLRVIGSLQSDFRTSARLIFEGDALPDECAELPLKLVKPLLTLHVYGSQRLTQVQSYEVIGPFEPIPLERPIDRAA